MMQVYLDALSASKSGKPQYVLKKSLDVFRTSDEPFVISALRSGYTATKVISGVMERTWRITKTVKDGALDKARYWQFLNAAGLSMDYAVLRICTQEFFTTSGEPEAVWMYLDAWKTGNQKPETIWITPKGKTADPIGYMAGQQAAKTLLDLLEVWSIRQDSNSLLRTLEKKNNI